MKINDSNSKLQNSCLANMGNSDLCIEIYVADSLYEKSDSVFKKNNSIQLKIFWKSIQYDKMADLF